MTSDAFWVRPPPPGRPPSGHPAAGQQGGEEASGEVGGTGCEELAVGSDRWIGGEGEGPARGDGLGEVHQGDADGAGQELRDEAGSGQRQRWQRLGNVAHGRDAGGAEAREP